MTHLNHVPSMPGGGQIASVVITRGVRDDHRCGPQFPLPDNSGPTQCDPDSDKFCCSKWVFS